MEKRFVDLHVHSCFSDGSLTPEGIACMANDNAVGLLALTDHDTVAGTQRLKAACAAYGIQTIPAVEIDSVEGNTNFHILAYGYREDDAEFLDFLSHTLFLLNESGVKLVERMQGDYAGLSIADFMDFSYDRRLGGWKALHYFMEKGLTASLKEGVRFYGQYNLTFDQSGYASIAAIAYRIRKAGGYSILAHPGLLIDTADIGFFQAELRRLMAYGLDGIECYYPYHSEAVTQACLAVCAESGLMVTSGSDCHGTFEETRIGQPGITRDRLVLRNLADS